VRWNGDDAPQDRWLRTSSSSGIRLQHFAGRQDNVSGRQAALIALAFNLLMVAAAIVSIMLTIPKHGTRAEDIGYTNN
jgi:hypothetical protein